jgi:serine-type D-Ala-D-Ala carboxypeptidase (penicillin-binding protein 5/6)
VTLNDPDDWLDHARLLDWGFKNYKLTSLIEKETVVEPGYVAGRSFTYALAEGEAADVVKKLEWTDKKSAAYRMGEAGTMTLLLGGKPIGAVPIYPAGSPRLSKQPETTDRHAYANQPAVVGFREGWTDVFGALLRTLFTGER